jgi:hypothetical protein
MLEAQVTTPAGGEEGGRAIAPPGPAGLGVTPVAYAGARVTVRERASSAFRAGLDPALPIPATERQRERRPGI